jgi:hypothetical protein
MNRSTSAAGMSTFRPTRNDLTSPRPTSAYAVVLPMRSMSANSSTVWAARGGALVSWFSFGMVLRWYHAVPGLRKAKPG